MANKAGVRLLNKLYYGDNLDVLRRNIADESVALIYLDPPFNSNRSYSARFPHFWESFWPPHRSAVV